MSSNFSSNTWNLGELTSNSCSQQLLKFEWFWYRLRAWFGSLQLLQEWNWGQLVISGFEGVAMACRGLQINLLKNAKYNLSTFLLNNNYFWRVSYEWIEGSFSGWAGRWFPKPSHRFVEEAVFWRGHMIYLNAWHVVDGGFGKYHFIGQVYVGYQESPRWLWLLDLGANDQTVVGW